MPSHHVSCVRPTPRALQLGRIVQVGTRGSLFYVPSQSKLCKAVWTNQDWFDSEQFLVFVKNCFYKTPIKASVEKTLISSFQKKPPCAATVSYTSIKSRSGHLQLWFEPATHPTISPQSPHSFLYYLIFSIVIFCPFSAVDLSCWLHIFSLLLLPSWFCTGYTYTDG